MRKLIEENKKEVILVVHSYLGMPGIEAPVSLGKKDHQAKGLRGGVTRLVYVMAFALLEGFTLTAGGEQYPEWTRLDADASTVYSKRRLSPCSCG
jgi:hypothetical protein